MASLEEKIRPLANQTDIILLPEMFSTGFTSNAKNLAETLNLNTHKWMQNMAEITNSVIAGSYIVREALNFYNRFLWVEPNGNFYYYDKKHLFSMGNENLSFKPGNKKLRIEYKGWVISPFICYDLRFPSWTNNSPNNPYDLMLFVASWPETRIGHWDALLKARAIENQAYCFGVNRVGTDGNNLNYNGHTSAYSFNGDLIYQLGQVEKICTVEIGLDQLKEYRKKLPFINDL